MVVWLVAGRGDAQTPEPQLECDEDEARELASQVEIRTEVGRIRAEGPNGGVQVTTE